MPDPFGNAYAHLHDGQFGEAAPFRCAIGLGAVINTLQDQSGQTGTLQMTAHATGPEIVLHLLVSLIPFFGPGRIPWRQSYGVQR